LQVLRQGGDAIGLHDQRPLLFEEAYVEVRVAGHVQGSPPALVDLLVGSDLKVHPLRLHEAHGPGIQIDDLDPLPLVPAQAAEVPFDTFRQVDRFRREQDAVGLLLEHLPGEVPGTVHGHHGLARPGAAQHTGRAVELLADVSFLAWVQEDAPLGQRGVQDRGQVVL